MISSNPIVDNSGRFLAPPQSEPAARPAGPWSANRGADVRRALAGERPIRERPIVTVCAWHEDGKEQTASARARGFDVSHSICPACMAKFESGAAA